MGGARPVLWYSYPLVRVVVEEIKKYLEVVRLGALESTRHAENLVGMEKQRRTTSLFLRTTRPFKWARVTPSARGEGAGSTLRAQGTTLSSSFFSFAGWTVWIANDRMADLVARAGVMVTKKRKMLGSKKLFVRLEDTPAQHTAVIFWDSAAMKDKKRLDESYKKGKYYWAIHDVRCALVAGGARCSLDVFSQSPSPPHPLAAQLTSIVATGKSVKVIGVTADEHATLIFGKADEASQWADEINAAVAAHKDDAASAAELAVKAGITDPSAGVADDGDGDAAEGGAGAEEGSADAATAAVPASPAAEVSAATITPTLPASPAAAVSPAAQVASLAAATPASPAAVAVAAASPVGRFVPSAKEEAEIEDQAAAAQAAGAASAAAAAKAAEVPTLPGSDPSIEPGKVEYDAATKRHKAFYYSQGTKVELGSFFTEAAATAVHDAVTYLKVNPYAEDFSVESLIDLSAPIDPAEGSVTFDDSLKKWVTKVSLFLYRYISCESFSQFDSLPLTYFLTI